METMFVNRQEFMLFGLSLGYEPSRNSLNFGSNLASKEIKGKWNMSLVSNWKEKEMDIWLNMIESKMLLTIFLF